MSVQDVANKVFKHYAGNSGPGENMYGLAASIARWTWITYSDALKALEKARNSENNHLKTSEDFIDEI